MQWLYLAGLIAVIGCLVAIDHKFKLAFFYQRQRTVMTLLISIWLFVVWDIFRIKLGIFFHGNSQFSLPIQIIPEFPLEELFFLLLLTYATLILYRFVQKRRA